MTRSSLTEKLPFREDLNFLLTNRIPRRLATQFIGWLSKVENPIIRDVSLATWKLFSSLDLSEAKKTTFSSMHDCFVRELKDGARPVDANPDILVSPCDAIVGACGPIAGTALFQVKGFPYELKDLVPDPGFADTYRNGLFVTLRLTASMYHRFHAPYDCRVRHVTSISGDTWNVNPIALKRIEKLFCKNERAAIRTELVRGGHVVTLVPVAAILVASIRLHFADLVLGPRYKGVKEIACDAAFNKGEEIGWFEHGSTIIVFAPEGFRLCDGVEEGTMIRMGRPLMRLP